MAVEMEGVDEVIASMNKEIMKINGRTQAGFYLAGQHIRRESQPEVPVVTSNLKNSAYVVAPGMMTMGRSAFKGKDSAKMSSQHAEETQRQKAILKAVRTPGVAIGYSALYAANVHENPRAGKTGGESPSGKKYTAGRTESGRKSRRIVWARKGKWKFLEDPLKREMKKVFQIIAMKAKIK